MRRVGAIAAAIVLAAVISNIGVDRAQAGDLAVGRPEKHLLFFAGTDVWRHGFSLHGGVVWSANGADRDGFVFKLLAAGGAYRFHSGALGNAEVTGHYVMGFALPGWRFKQDRLIVTVFAGLDVAHHRLRPDDPSSKLRGTVAGARGAIEIWYEPNASTMLEASASLASVGPSYSARAAYGWRLFEKFYVGPEVQGFAFDDNYRQFRAGLHLTALKTENFEYSGALGWARDSNDRHGFYARLGRDRAILTCGSNSGRNCRHQVPG